MKQIKRQTVKTFSVVIHIVVTKHGKMKLISAFAFISWFVLVSGAPGYVKYATTELPTTTISTTTAAPLPFEGHQVIRTYPTTAAQVQLLQGLEETLDFWSPPRLNGPTDIRFSAAELDANLRLLQANEIRFEVWIQNVQDVVNEEEQSQVRTANAVDWTSYRSVAEIQSWLTNLVAQNQDVSELIDIGNSTEGRRMLVIRIGYPSTDGSAKRSYFTDAGIHAREWITPAICTYFINELLTNRGQYDDLLRQIDFYFLPNANPDGYEFSRARNGDRLWRKTRSSTDDPICFGVDPNRNFAHGFGGNGTSARQCSDIYRGPSAFSEPETRAISQFILNRTADWRMYNALHSYSQEILTPWGFTDSLPDDYEDLKTLGEQAANALTAVHNTSYKVGSLAQLLASPGSGGSDDWAKGSGVFNYSYTLEVRDSGRYGFLLPANQIIPCAEETLQAVLVFANFLKKPKVSKPYKTLDKIPEIMHQPYGYGWGR